MPNSARNGKKIGVGWHFQIGHTYDSYHTKGEPWISLMKAVTPTVPKKTLSSPLPFIYI